LKYIPFPKQQDNNQSINMEGRKSYSKMDALEIRNKMSDYSDFVEKVLRPELKQAMALRQNVKTEIQEYRELQQRLKKQQKDDDDELKQAGSSVDLGFKTIYCRAVATDLSKLFVHVGMGFHVELSTDEATQFVAKRISLLQDSNLEAKEEKVKEVSNHLESAEVSFAQLATELQRHS
jgi:prefoldin subunit 5